MKQIVPFITVFLAVSCSSLAIPAYENNGVPQSFFASGRFDNSSKMVVFPPEASYREDSPCQGGRMDMTFYSEVVVSTAEGDRPGSIEVLEGYGLAVHLKGIQTHENNGRSFAGSCSASLELDFLANDRIYDQTFEGNANVSGTIPSGPISISISTDKGIFAFKFDKLTEINTQ